MIKKKLNPFAIAKEKGFSVKSSLPSEVLNELETLIDRDCFNWYVVGEKIDERGNPIWLLFDDESKSFAHFYISSGGGALTYMSVIDYVSWC